LDLHLAHGQPRRVRRREKGLFDGRGLFGRSGSGRRHARAGAGAHRGQRGSDPEGRVRLFGATAFAAHHARGHDGERAGGEGSRTKEEGADQRPRYTGGRFSRNAVSPSRASAVANSSANPRASKSARRSSAGSPARSSVRLNAASASGALLAIVRAISWVRWASSAAGKT